MIGAIMARKAIRGQFTAINNHDLATFMLNIGDDCTFVYPGNLAVSGTYQGKPAIEGWFQRMFERFPTIEFTVRDICLRNAWDFLGNNVIAALWDVHVITRGGFEGRNIGVTTITSRRRKALHIREVLFAQDDNWRQCWGAM